MNLVTALETTPVTGIPPLDGRDSTQTIFQVIAELQSSIRTAFEPALHRRSKPSYDGALLHPLSITTKTLSFPSELLSSSLRNFEEQVLNSSTLAPGLSEPSVTSSSSASQAEKTRLLVLSKEYSALHLQESILKEGQDVCKSILDRRKGYSLPFPAVKRDDEKIQQVLEGIAKECGLEIFIGNENDENMAVDEMSEGNKMLTFTMAGKGIVLDIDMDFTVQGQQEEIIAARFSYGLEGNTDQGIDKLLARQAKGKLWAQFQSSLVELVRLDALVSSQNESQVTHGDKGIDPFGAMKSLALKAEEVFQAELYGKRKRKRKKQKSDY